MDMESINGQMEENSQATGYAIRCMVVEFSLGMMAGNIKVNIMTIKNKDMECLHGQMVANMMDSGWVVNKKV